LSTCCGDRGYPDPDDRVVRAGLLDPVGENGIVCCSEPDIPEVGSDVVAEIDVLAGISPGSIPEFEPDLVIGERDRRTRDGVEFAVRPVRKERRWRSYGDIVGLLGGIGAERVGGSERDGVGPCCSICVGRVLDGRVGGVIAEGPVPGSGRVGGEIGELDGERPDALCRGSDEIDLRNRRCRWCYGKFVEFVVDTAIPGSDLEPSSLPPASSPAVFTNPIRSSFILTPTDDDNTVAPLQNSPCIFIDATFIIIEICVHIESSNDRSPRQRLLDCIFIGKWSYSVPLGYAIIPAATGVTGRVLSDIGIAGLVHDTTVENPVEGAWHGGTAASPASCARDEVLLREVRVDARVVIGNLHP